MQSGIGALCGLWTISEYFSGCVDVAVRVCVLAVEHMIGTGLDWLAGLSAVWIEGQWSEGAHKPLSPGNLFPAPGIGSPLDFAKFVA